MEFFYDNLSQKESVNLKSQIEIRLVEFTNNLGFCHEEDELYEFNNTRRHIEDHYYGPTIHTHTHIYMCVWLTRLKTFGVPNMLSIAFIYPY